MLNHAILNLLLVLLVPLQHSNSHDLVPKLECTAEAAPPACLHLIEHRLPCMYAANDYLLHLPQLVQGLVHTRCSCAPCCAGF
jgi:hypothetical protein